MPAYFKRTPKGQQEVESTTRGLPQALRTVLLLVDGRRSADQLGRMLASATPEALRRLLDLGLIAPTPVPPSQRLPESADAASHFADSAAPSRFEWVPRQAHEAVTDVERAQIERSLRRALGPAAEALAESARQARTVRELLDVVRAAHRAIANARGKEIADEFASRYGGLGET